MTMSPPKAYSGPIWGDLTATLGAQLRFEGAGGRPHAADADPPEGQSLMESGSLFKVSGAARPRATGLIAGQVDDCA